MALKGVSLFSGIGGLDLAFNWAGGERKDVATAARISERAVRKFEEGICYPTKDTYNKVAQIFGWEVWP